MAHTSDEWKKEGLSVIVKQRGIICKCPAVTEGGVFEVDANSYLIAAAPELLKGAELALVELDRIGSDIGFEPDRYRERIAALDALSRAFRKVGGNNA